MCCIDARKKLLQTSLNDGISGDGNDIPSNEKTKALASLCVIFDFISFWLNFFDHEYIEHFNMYNDNMECLFCLNLS